MDIIPTDISTYGEDVEGLLNEIQSRNEKLFELTFLLMNTADNKRKLDNIVYQTAFLRKCNHTFCRQISAGYQNLCFDEY